MWNNDLDKDVDLLAIVGALILGADHALTPAEIHKVVEDVEVARRSQTSENNDVSDLELEATQVQADLEAGKTLGTIPQAEAVAAMEAAKAAREAREAEAAKQIPSKICPPSEVRKAVTELRGILAKAGIGFELVEVNGGYRLQTSSICGPWVRQLLGKGRATVLSRPSIETLAIIAYRQPVSRSEIESVRGVNAGHVIKALMEMQLVRIVGRSELPGRPFLFGTTPVFLEHFGLKSLDDLEKIAGAQDLLRDNAESKPAKKVIEIQAK